MPDVNLDSYLAQIGHSFYGGPNGRNFEIKEPYFSSKRALDADLLIALTSSPIQIGDFALVTYGDHNNAEEYLNNRENDIILEQGSEYSTEINEDYTELIGEIQVAVSDLYIDNYTIIESSDFASFTIDGITYYSEQDSISTKIYDGTLWQKKLDTNGNIYYQLLTSYQGRPMSLAITSETLPASSPPFIVEAGDSALEDKHYLLKLPVAWDISITQDTSPTLPTEPISLSGPVESGSNRTWTLNKPKAYSFTIGTVIATNPGAENAGPTVTMRSSGDTDSSPTANRLLDFKIPKPWSITTVAGSPTIPTATTGIIESTVVNENTHQITIHPIQAWDVVTDTTISQINPLATPNISVRYGTSATHTHTIPQTGDYEQKLHFSLPKSWNMELGQATFSANPGSPADWKVNINTNEEDSDSDTPPSAADDTKYVHFTLPKPWSITITQSGDWVPAATPLTITGSTATAETVTWSINKPRAYSFTMATPSYPEPGITRTPSVSITTSTDGGLETKIFNFTIPETWDFALGSDSGNINPSVTPITPTIDTTSQPGGAASTDTKYLHYQVQKAWKIAGGTVTTLTPGATPTASINRSSDDSTIEGDSPDTKYIHLGLPKAWNVACDTPSYTVPSASPTVSMSESNDDKILHFTLPAVQEFTTDSFTLTTVGPTRAASITTSFNDSVDPVHKYPLVNLTLPRAAKTAYGSALQVIQNATVERDSADGTALANLAVGDLYINTKLAAVHQIETITEDVITTRYLGSMQLSIPTVTNGTPINPYDANGNAQAGIVVAPQSTVPVANWAFEVQSVKAPVINLDAQVIQSLGTGSITRSVFPQGVTFTMRIPKGTGIYTGTTAPTVSSLRQNDLWLNSDTGILKRYDGDNTWSTGTSLRGNSFAIKNQNSYVVAESSLPVISGDTNIYHRIGAYLTSYTPTASVVNNLKPNEIVTVEYTDNEDATSSLWLFKVDNVWSGSKVTGDASNALLDHDWEFENPNENKTYDELLINALYNRVTALEETVAVLTNAFESAWGPLEDLVPSQEP